MFEVLSDEVAAGGSVTVDGVRRLCAREGRKRNGALCVPLGFMYLYFWFSLLACWDRDMDVFVISMHKGGSGDGVNP